MLLRRRAEFLLVRHRGFHEQVERPFRLNALKPKFFQPVVERLAVSVIERDVCFLIQARLHDLLLESRRIYESEDTGSHICRGDQVLTVSRLVRDDKVSDTLARKREGFAVGISHPTMVFA